MTRSFAVAIFAAMFAFAAQANDFSTLSFPLGINVDGTYVPSTMYLQLKVKQYDTPMDSFAIRQLDPREATFVALMNALREKNYVRAETLLERRAVAAQVEQARSRVVQKPRSIRETVDLYNSAFNGLRDVTVVSQVLAGSKSLFVWEASTPNGPFRRAFSVGLAGQKLTASEVTMDNPLEVLILNNVMNPMAKEPAGYKPVATMKKRFDCALPIDGPGDPGPNRVALQFDGQPLDFDVFDEKTPASDEVTRLYRTAYHAFRIGAIDEYVKYFTPISREKMRKWLGSMAPQTMDQFQAAVTAGRKLQLVINADPVYLVFYTSPMQQMPRGTMQYDYILRQADGKLAFANVGRESFLDDVLKNPALFDLNDVLGITGKKQQ